MKKKGVIISICLVILCIAFTLIVKYVDVSPIGPNDSSVGLSALNKFFHELIGVNMGFYTFTNIMGAFPIIMVLAYVVVGVVQLVKRKSLLKVDKELFVLAGLYVAVLCIYVLFEKVTINFRPTLIDGELEASYPSSHTLLSLCICGSTIIYNKFMYSRIKITKYENIVAFVSLLLILFGRIVSGVHWFSDILGGMIISITLIYIFANVLTYVQNKKV